MRIVSFFDSATCTYSHLIVDPASARCAIVDPVLDYDPAAARIGHDGADRLIGYIRQQGLEVDWLLETHVHADHLSAAHYLRDRLGGRLGIGAGIPQVQETFGELFDAEADFPRDGSQFDRLFADGERFRIGTLDVEVLHTPGHTPACITYRVGDAAFVGDTLFMPDSGTARCDFPGGDPRQLYRSIRRLFELPDETRLFLCHDYKAPGRERYCGETSVGEQRAHNIHVGQAMSEDAFVALRSQRDQGLEMPRLLLPAVQVNMRAGELPPPAANGRRYLKLPLDCF
ncbi:MBL fold metallo-hydrolase [Pseudomonas mangiferae]|uniref:MBL fold metallo-hydrolase n=1 Tax=Pseudomonas mangiferae TaxID=2593654 RepID=A0A553GTE5_9PSED|nr:MBL fold metallo-hydrolase [Pseudomonas mangiferae]TRX72769.1 MBL fold metallo-hydrolase [Pseudomonas mangiferae]